VEDSIHGRTWDSPLEACQFLHHKLFDRATVFRAHNFALVGSAWKPVPVEVDAVGDVGYSLARAEAYTTVASMAEIFKYAQGTGLQRMPGPHESVIADATGLLHGAIEAGMIHEVDSRLCIMYDAALYSMDLNRVLEALCVLAVCPGVDVRPVIIDFGVFHVAICDLLANYNSSNVVLLLRRVATHMNSIAWIVQYVMPCAQYTFDLDRTPPFDDEAYDLCRPPEEPPMDNDRPWMVERRVFTFQQILFLIMLVHEVADIATLVRRKATSFENFDPECPFDTAVRELTKLGNPQSPETVDLVLPPDIALACVPVLDRLVHGFPCFATHVYLSRSATGNAEIRNVWASVTVQLAFLYARRVFAWAAGVSEVPITPIEQPDDEEYDTPDESE
jgi:hypothetical protein